MHWHPRRLAPGLGKTSECFRTESWNCSRRPKMTIEETDRQWYAVRVKPRHEKRVASVLKSKGFETFLPVCRKRRVYGTRAKEVELPLFDGYLFCRFDPNRRLPILITPSVVYIVGDGRSLVSVAEAEIDSLRRAVEARLALHPHDYLRVG